MRLVCDTSVLIDHLRGYRPATELLTERVAAGDDLWSATICRAEVVAGMRSAERRATFALLDGLQWLDLDAELADRAGVLARTYRRSHPGVEIADYVVAATAELLDARLLTLNVRHFPMISGLKSAY